MSSFLRKGYPKIDLDNLLETVILYRNNPNVSSESFRHFISEKIKSIPNASSSSPLLKIVCMAELYGELCQQLINAQKIPSAYKALSEFTTIQERLNDYLPSIPLEEKENDDDDIRLFRRWLSKLVHVMFTPTYQLIPNEVLSKQLTDLTDHQSFIIPPSL